MKRIVIIISCTWLSLCSFAQQQNPSRQAVNEKLKELRTISDSVRLNEVLSELKKGKSEEDLQVLYSWYASQKGAAANAIEISELAEKKFPKGSFAFSKASASFNDENDLVQAEKLLKTIIREFPNQNTGMLTYSLAKAFASEGNTKKMMEYFNKIKGMTGMEGAYPSLLYSLSVKNSKDAEPLLKPVVDSLRMINTNSSDPADRKAQSALNNYYALATSYGKALLSNGKPEEAYILAKELVNKAADKSPSVSGLYLTTLLATKRWKEAQPLVEKAILENNATAEVEAKLKDMYVGVIGTDKGFTEYEKQLKQTAENRVVEEALKQAINQPSVDFTLKDVNGKLVHLSELKGKVVVLDFWATWCGPCKASFPAMQNAVNKYKNDPGVVFYFVHTMDKSKGDPTIEAKDYITKNNYSFDVLMDIRSDQTGKSKVADGYNIKGIPTKLVIDPAGNIRFNIVGFGGGNETAVKELSAMIEYAKNAKK